jgi:hypothetical protein
MADVPNHLVPRDGLTNSAIRFDGLDINHNDDTVHVTFGIYDDYQARVTEYVIEVPLADYPGGVNGLIAHAHVKMTDILRQWLHLTDTMRRGYETP